MEGYKYPFPKIEPLGPFFCAQGARPEPGLGAARPACRWEAHRGMCREAGLSPAWAGWPGTEAGQWPEAAGLSPAWAGQTGTQAGHPPEPPGLGPA